jgi:hypothetical protein
VVTSWKSKRALISTQESSPPTAARTKDFRIHHHFPSVDWKISVVETPIKFFRGDWLIRWVVVWRNVLVGKTFSRVDSLAWIEHKHLFEQIQSALIIAS